jgi:sec-independent protein translocase protein TatA
VTYTSTAVVPEVNWANAGNAPASRAASRVILFLQFPRERQGATMLGRIGIPELVIILLIILVLFGASRLPEIGRGIGKGIRNFKDATRDGEKEGQRTD